MPDFPASTYAKVAQASMNHTVSSQAHQPSPKVVIPVRKDLNLQEFTAMESEPKIVLQSLNLGLELQTSLIEGIRSKLPGSLEIED